MRSSPARTPPWSGCAALKPVVRPELTAALAALGETSAELILTPSADTRRVAEEMVPELPGEIGGGPITVVTRGLRWTALGLASGPEPGLQLVVQAKDAEAAGGLDVVLKKMIQALHQMPQFPAELARLVDELNPELNQDRITLSIDAQKASKLVAAITAPMRANAARSQSTNNMKQIALAMHNYLSQHGSFPPAYTVDKAGKPLLSWRVLVLPFLEQDALYKEFHLDEPWDSDHNRALIDRMPAVYRCPAARTLKADAGKTTYLTPRGTATIFPGSEGVKIQKITDGTSNTIMLVDAADDRAVVWTRPDDWNVDPKLDMKGIFGHFPGGTILGFADGSVRFIKETVELGVFEKLITKDGGEVISSDQY